MKIMQILYESPKDEHRLQLISKYLTRAIKKEVAVEKKYREQDAKRGVRSEPPYVEMGAIKDIIPTKVLSHLYNRLGRIKVNVNYGADAKGEGGHFDSETNTVQMNYSADTDSNMDEFESTINHELRHALDNSLSKGWAFGGTPRDKKPIDDENHPINKRNALTGAGDYEYLASPHEINARFSQVQRDITKLVKSKMRNQESLSVRDFMSELYNLLHSRDLGEIYPTKDEKENALRRSSRQIAGFASGIPSKPLDNKDYQQILKRAIKYFDAEKQRLTQKSK